MATAISARANKTIQGILRNTPEDSAVLNRFKEQFIRIESKFPLLRDYIIYEGQVCMAVMQKDKAQSIVETAFDEECYDSNTVERILTADEEFFERNRDCYMNNIADIQAVLDNAMPYMQTYAKLQQLEEKQCKEAKEKEAPLALMFAPAFPKLYSISIKAKTHSNAIKTAIEIYMIKAQTGKLPDVLPVGLPKDLFSGKDFEYEKTDDGFVLRCQGKDLSRDEIYEYGFKVKE